MKPRTRSNGMNDSTGTMSGHQGRGKAAKDSVNRFRRNILAWYDKNRRVMPWRALPGRRSDPYHVWLSEVMLQQTVVAAVQPYFLKFIKKWPSVHDLAAAPQDDVMAAWAGLGYYARARNLYKCAQVVSRDLSGAFPGTVEELRKLPGIGDYTAAAIAAIAFDKAAAVVDGNVERVLARFYGVEEPLPAAKKTLRAHAEYLASGRDDRPGDFAQGMMDLGATICTPRSPRCGACPLSNECAALAVGNAAELPRRAPKKAKPQKFGYVYWITDQDGRVLFERRDENSMLGGMVGLPTSEWLEKGKRKPPHIDLAKGVRKTPKHDLRIFHSFTHFDLELEGRELLIEKNGTGQVTPYFWVEQKKIKNIAVPSLFRKFIKIAADS